MKDIKPSRKNRQMAYFFALLTGAAIFGLFFQAWKVYAFDVQDVVNNMPRHVSRSAALPPSIASAPPPASIPSQRSMATPASEDRWSDGDVVAALSSFYQTIITYMGILIGIMGVLSVITLRFFSKVAAEDMAHEAAKSAMLHYLETSKFRDEVTFAVQDIGLANQLEFLERELVDIKKFLKERQPTSVDTSEDEEGTIESPPKHEDS